MRASGQAPVCAGAAKHGIRCLLAACCVAFLRVRAPAYITPSSAAQIQECKRLLRPGGVLAFVDINPDRLAVKLAGGTELTLDVFSTENGQHRKCVHVAPRL